MDETNGGTPRGAREEGTLTNLANAVAREQRARARREGEEPRGRKSRIHPSLLVALLLTLGVLLWLEASGTDNVIQVPVELTLQEAIYLTALALEAEREATEAYPPDLATIGMDEEGLRYERQSDSYVLVAEEDGVRIEYHAGEDLEPFRAAFENLLPPFEEGR